MAEQTIRWMDNVRGAVREILAKVDQDGKITLGDAERITAKYTVNLATVLGELEQRCKVNYDTGIILCRG